LEIRSADTEGGPSLAKRQKGPSGCMDAGQLADARRDLLQPVRLAADPGEITELEKGDQLEFAFGTSREPLSLDPPIGFG
jgi:hypothetical protein